MNLFFSKEQHTRDGCLGNRCCWNLIESTESSVLISSKFSLIIPPPIAKYQRLSVRICPICVISGPLNILLNPLITNFNQRLVAINRAKGTLTSNPRLRLTCCHATINQRPVAINLSPLTPHRSPLTSHLSPFIPILRPILRHL